MNNKCVCNGIKIKDYVCSNNFEEYLGLVICSTHYDLVKYKGEITLAIILDNEKRNPQSKYFNETQH